MSSISSVSWFSHLVAFAMIYCCWHEISEILPIFHFLFLSYQYSFPDFFSTKKQNVDSSTCQSYVVYTIPLGWKDYCLDMLCKVGGQAEFIGSCLHSFSNFLRKWHFPIILPLKEFDSTFCVEVLFFHVINSKISVLPFIYLSCCSY